MFTIVLHRYFWETVHELSEEQQRQLLQFTTGSDRVPIGGLSQLKLVIARNGSDSDRYFCVDLCELLRSSYNNNKT